MEIGQIIHLPLLIEAVRGQARFPAARRLDGIGAEDDHIQSSWRGVVDPFRGEFPD